ncbi:MAG TPA: tetratricopeptide repeat protein, partial [Fimbriimonadaceae bacterium]|nr:tetratricopeptide repeat protein [Fimbriimonadaceae bacterium]
NRHEEAIDWLQKCIGKSEKNESHIRKAQAMLAGSYQALGQLEEAMSVLTQALEITPNDPELNFSKARLDHRAGNFAAAREHYIAALSCDMSSEFSSFDIGIQGYKTLHNLGDVEMESGNYAAARDWWTKALEAGPQQTGSAHNLFGAALALGDFKTAMEMLRTVEEREGRTLSWAECGTRYAEALNGPDAALDFLQKSLAEDDRNLAVRLAYARLLLARDIIPPAVPHLQHLAEAGVAEGAFLLGVFLIRVGRFEEALAQMQRAHESNPDHEETLRQIAALRKMLGREED